MEPDVLKRLKILNDFVKDGVATQLQFDEYDCLLEYRKYEMEQLQTIAEPVSEEADEDTNTNCQNCA